MQRTTALARLGVLGWLTGILGAAQLCRWTAGFARPAPAGWDGTWTDDALAAASRRRRPPHPKPTPYPAPLPCPLTRATLACLQLGKNAGEEARAVACSLSKDYAILFMLATAPPSVLSFFQLGTRSLQAVVVQASGGRRCGGRWCAGGGGAACMHGTCTRTQRTCPRPPCLAPCLLTDDTVTKLFQIMRSVGTSRKFDKLIAKIDSSQRLTRWPRCRACGQA